MRRTEARRTPSAPGPFDFSGPVEVIAHRGYSAVAPENTQVALARGLDAGADAVEFDLHMSSDGVPVLFHDSTLERTTNGTGPIGGCDSARLGALDAGSWFASEYEGEPVPTLEDVATGVGQRAARLYAEIKGYGRHEDLDAMVRIVRDAELAERTVFISMDWESLDRIRLADPHALIGYIVESAQRAPAAIERATADPRALLDFDARVLLAEPSLAETASEQSIPLATWTVNTTEEAERLLLLGVRRFTTNQVELLVDWKARL
jgi:glycerophosphoryl diester phosphodiesterase